MLHPTSQLLSFLLTTRSTIVLAANQEQQIAPTGDAWVEAVRIVPGLAWPLLLIVVFILFRHSLRQLVDLIIWRPIRRSAWAKFVCNARVEFVDGSKAMIWRLIDFEMGAIGNIGPQDAVTKLEKKLG
jgi:hypothetical protein